VEKLDDLQIDQISQIISSNKRNLNDPNQQEAYADGEYAEDMGGEGVYADENQDNVGDLPQNAGGNDKYDNFTSVSQQKPTQSQVSGMSGKTYISSL